MLLFHSPTSPFVRKVMILLHEAEKVDQVTMVPGSGTPLSPNTETQSRNPLGKIPCLERAEGPALYDSRVICRYLDSLFDTGLYPQDARLWDSLTLEATGDGIMDAALSMVYERKLRSADAQDENWVESQWNKIEHSLKTLDERWVSHLAGPLCIGQISLACALGYCDFRHANRGWREIAPAVADWHAKFAKRNSYSKTEPAD